MPSTRRRFLAAVATTGTAAGVVGLAGCAAVRESPYSPGSDADSRWPVPAYDRGFSGYNPDAAAPRDGVTVRWRTELPSRPSGRPVVAGGAVLIPTAPGLFAYDLADGAERWRLDADESLWPASPSVHDGTVYVGLADVDASGPALRALDAGDGSEAWSYDTRGDVRVPPVLEVDGDGAVRAVYAGDDTGRVYKLRPDGSVEHRRDVFGAVTRLALDRTLLVGTEGGEVYSFFDANDRLQGLWRRKLDGKVTAIAARGGAILAATFGGPLYRLRDGAHAGRSDWTHERGATNLAVTGGDVVGTDGGGLTVYDARTGTQRWRVDGRFGASPAVAGDLVIAGGGDVGEGGTGFVAAYGLRGDLTDGVLGRARWTFETDEAVMEGVAVADGAVFAATQGADGPARLYALDPA